MGRFLFYVLSALMLSGFAKFPGWQQLDVSPAYAALQQACHQQRLDSSICAELTEKTPKSKQEKQAFFEKHYVFQPIEGEGLLTGYYLPLLEGSRTQSAEYPYPVWGLPPDFATPYLSRQEIDSGALEGKMQPLLWVKDKVELFFMHVQGSGRVRLPDGEIIGLGFVAKNGLPYQSIGKLLIDEGEISKEAMSLQALRNWLRAHPEQVDRVLWHNPSYIFFQQQADKAAIGAQGIALTPRGSFAVDPSHIPYGTPVLVHTVLPQATQPEWILAIAQDTGSAIRGEARADWFLGYGEAAEELAGNLKQPAHFTLLKPKRAGHE